MVLFHGDIHNENWGVSNNCLILYDFGYCINCNYITYELSMKTTY